MPYSFEVISPVNNEHILARNLRSSADIRHAILPLKVLKNQISAAVAYNFAIDTSESDILIFAHQDVYLPKLWLDQLQNSINLIEQEDKSWGVIGLFGLSTNGQHVGRVWSSGLGRELGAPFHDPIPATTIDELVIVMRRGSGLRFSDSLPGFHLYATDICLQARHKGMGVYVVHAPVVHNSRPVRTLRGQFVAAYRYMKRSYHCDLPIQTLIVPLTRGEIRLWHLELRLTWRRFCRATRNTEPLDAHVIATNLGYE